MEDRLTDIEPIEMLWFAPEARPTPVVVSKRVIVGKDVPHIGDERQPCGLFGRGRAQAPAVKRVVDHGSEFMRGNSWRQPAQRNLDVGATGHVASGWCATP